MSAASSTLFSDPLKDSLMSDSDVFVIITASFPASYSLANNMCLASS